MIEPGHIPSNEEHPQIHDDVLEILQNDHERLTNGYITPEAYSDSCAIVACKIATKLLAAGMRPYLLVIRGGLKNGGNTESLKLVLMKGDMKWGAHIVCAEGEIAYDPVVGNPLPIDEYLKKMFDQSVTYEVMVPPEKMEEFIAR